MKENTVTITKENLKKAYENGCEDVRVVLKNLFPDELLNTWEDVTPRLKIEDDDSIFDGRLGFVRIDKVSFQPDHGYRMNIDGAIPFSSVAFRVENGRLLMKKK